MNPTTSLEAPRIKRFESRRRSRLLPKPTKGNAAYVLALDLSLNRPGYAVLRITEADVTLASCGHLAVKTKRGRETVKHGERLREIREWIGSIVERHPELERTFAKEEVPLVTHRGGANVVKTIYYLGKAHGEVEEAIVEFDHIDIPQATVKLLVTGDGKAEKGEVETAVRGLLRVPDDFQFSKDRTGKTIDDESDACAVGLAYLALQERLPADGRFDAMRSRVVAHKAKAARKKSQGKRKGRAA